MARRSHCRWMAPTAARSNKSKSSATWLTQIWMLQRARTLPSRFGALVCLCGARSVGRAVGRFVDRSCHSLCRHAPQTSCCSRSAGHNTSLLQKHLCSKIPVLRQVVSEVRFLIRFLLSFGMVLHWLRGTFAATQTKCLQLVVWCEPRFGTTFMATERLHTLKRNVLMTLQKTPGAPFIRAAGASLSVGCVVCVVLCLLFCCSARCPLHTCQPIKTR